MECTKADFKRKSIKLEKAIERIIKKHREIDDTENIMLFFKVVFFLILFYILVDKKHLPIQYENGFGKRLYKKKAYRCILRDHDFREGMTKMMKQSIRKLNDIEAYTPSGHSGTTNHRLTTADEGGVFELVHGVIEPYGVADPHSHENEKQVIYIVSGRAKVILGSDVPEICESQTVINIPAGVKHMVESIGPDPLELVIVYSPPISA